MATGRLSHFVRIACGQDDRGEEPEAGGVCGGHGLSDCRFAEQRGGAEGGRLTLRSSVWQRPGPELQIVVKTAGPGQGRELFAALLRPDSLGRVELSDRDPLSPPRVTTGFLTEPGDRARLAEAFVDIRELAASGSRLPLMRRLAAPSPSFDWRTASVAVHLDSQHWSYFHPGAT